MRRSIKIILMIICMFVFTKNVDALATASVGFGGNSTVSVGDNITIDMYVSNVTDTVGGIVSVGGNLSFDSEYLEYVSGVGVTSPYVFQINPSASYKIAGLDSTLSSGIISTGQTKVFTFVFKAKKIGGTQITLTNPKLSDTTAKISSAVNPKMISIVEASASISNDASLKNLSVEGYTISPAFSSSVFNYSVKVPSTTTSVTISGEKNDSKAIVSGLGSINLTTNETNATIKVTAEDGSIKNYVVKIIKEVETVTPVVQKSSDASLKSLDASGYTLTPTFSSKNTTYSMKVKNNITSLDVTAIANNNKAAVTIIGNTDWKEGNNTISIKVVAEDNTVKTYTVNVLREASAETPVVKSVSADNYLKNLTINSTHKLSPSFNKNVDVYSIMVPYEITKLDLTLIANDKKSSIQIIGNDNFEVDKINEVIIEVKAENGDIRNYKLNVTRSSAKNNTYLTSIKIKGVELNPDFSQEQLEYTTKVSSKTDKLDIEVTTLEEKANVQIIGNESLHEGENLVLIRVTDTNGFVKYYQIKVTKEAIKRIFGLDFIQFITIVGIIILLLILLVFLLKKREDEMEEYKRKLLEKKQEEKPVIEFKPTFNIGLPNNNENVQISSDQQSIKKLSDPKIIDAEYNENIPYDPYDDVVTKVELIDAINEATETKDPSKLEMLLDQEALNKRKIEIMKKEEEKQNEEHKNK